MSVWNRLEDLLGQRSESTALENAPRLEAVSVREMYSDACFGYPSNIAAHLARVHKEVVSKDTLQPCTEHDAIADFLNGTTREQDHLIGIMCIQGNAFAAIVRDAETGVPKALLPSECLRISVSDKGDLRYTLRPVAPGFQGSRANGDNAPQAVFVNAETNPAIEHLPSFDFPAEDVLHYKFNGWCPDYPVAPSPVLAVQNVLVHGSWMTNRGFEQWTLPRDSSDPIARLSDVSIVREMTLEAYEYKRYFSFFPFVQDWGADSKDAPDVALSKDFRNLNWTRYIEIFLGHARAIEAELTAKLLPRDSRAIVAHDLLRLLGGESMSSLRVAGDLIDYGLATTNEVRRCLLHLAPVEGGDVLRQPRKSFLSSRFGYLNPDGFRRKYMNLGRLDNQAIFEAELKRRRR